MTNSMDKKTKNRSTKASPGGSSMPTWQAFETGYKAASSNNAVSHGEQRERLVKPLMSP